MNFHSAVMDGNLDRVRLLVEQGADKEMGDVNDSTPLLLASCHGHLDMVQYLVEKGVKIDKPNDIGHTPLMAAAWRGHLEVTRYLLEQGADREKADNNGKTPLHKAAFYGRLETVMLLMRYGADLNARDNYGKLPIDMTHNEEIKQAIRDEPRRRMDEAPGKRATEQDRHPNSATLAPAQQEEDEGVEDEQSNKRPRLDEGAAVALVAEVETKVAEEDEDSEPSSDENDD